MAPASGYSAVHILWIRDMSADGSCVRGVYYYCCLHNGVAYYGICLTVNISVNLGIVRFPGKLDFFECYLGTTSPRTITFTSLLDAD